MNTCGTFILVKGHTNPSIIQHRMIIIIGEKSYRSDSTFMGTLHDAGCKGIVRIFYWLLTGYGKVVTLIRLRSR